MLGRIKNLFVERKSSAMDALFDLGAQTAATIAVSPSAALRCVPVYAGARVRCETLGSMPFLLYKRRDDQGKDRATDHELYHLLHDRPNGWTSAADFIMQIELDTITDGAGYALANRSGDKIVELIRLAPGSVECKTDDATLEPKYEVTLKNNTRRTYRWQDILHVPAFGGLSPIKQAREAIGVCMAMEQYAGKLFGNGGRPSGVLKVKGKLSPTSHDRIRDSWRRLHGGENAGGTAILEDGTEFAPLAFNSVDLQFQELRGFQVIEIARALGVPPMLLMDFGRATWGNSEQMAQAFLTFTLLPRMKLWQGAVMRLLSADDQNNIVPEFLADALVTAEIAARFEAYSKAITNGFLNPNEVRAMENRPPYEGGNEFRVPMNTEAPAGRAQSRDETAGATGQAEDCRMKPEWGFAFDLDTKAISDDGEFSGYAAIFGNEDLGRDIIVKGAFAKSLARCPAAKVKMLRQHDPEEPIGVWLDLIEDSKGLRAKGKLILDTVKGRETHALMRAGALDGLSIGFRTLKDRFDRAKGIRFVEEVELPEISVVTFPMNPRATVATVKSHDIGSARLSCRPSTAPRRRLKHETSSRPARLHRA